MAHGGRSHARGAYLLLAVAVVGSPADAQHAVEVVAYEPGQGAAGAYTDPTAALGPPTRLSGSDLDPSVVTPFQPAWSPSELVTIGAGGQLTISFDQEVRDDPDNPFGVDLLLFGNAFFMNYASGSPCVSGLYEEGGMVEVSLDGIDFVPIEGGSVDGLFPTMGYLDAEPFGVEPGTLESDFTRPVDPAHASAMLAGMCWEELTNAYAGSGGGAGIDLAPTRLAAIRFVRISVAPDAMFLPELDAVADVAPLVGADFDQNGRVDGGDLVILLGAWGQDDPALDLDGDGVVTGGDLLILLGEWD